MIELGLLIGAILSVPLAWLTGMFNPIGFMGVPPWHVPESARAASRENRLWTPQYHEEWLTRREIKEEPR
jgi:hypothetical protein